MESLVIKNYFLGKLNQSEVEKLEIEIISNPDLEVQFHQAEEDLIEDYLENSLSEEDLKAFQNNYLISEDRQTKVEILRELKNFSRKATAVNSIKEEKPGFFEQIKAIFGLRPIPLAFAVLSLFLLIGFVWFWNFGTQQSPLDKEIIALNTQDLSNLENFQNLKTLNLASGTTRSGGNTNNLAEKDLTERILLRLALQSSSGSTKNFTVKISKDGQVLQTFNQSSYQNQEVRLLLPKSFLKKGEYQITLEKDNEKFNYYFSIQ